MSGTDSGGAYYATAVGLRSDAALARADLAELESVTGWGREYRDGLKPLTLTLRYVGLELASAIYCLAQSLEDGRR